MRSLRALPLLASLAGLAACGLVGSTASTVGSLGSAATGSASQGSGASSNAFTPAVGEAGPDGAAPVGQICGDPSIVGRVIPEIEDGAACGVPGAVRVASVGGVALSPQPTLGCDTARALNAWVTRGVIPEFERSGADLAGLRLSRDYACTAADGPGHNMGEAVDVSGFDLEDGTTLRVIDATVEPEANSLLQTIHQRACGPFSGTIGPWTGSGSAEALHYDTVTRDGLHCR